MEYLLVMSLSGSTMTSMHLLLRLLLKDKTCARFYDLLARVAILYYLIPLPYLKKYYAAAFRVIWTESSLEISRVPLTWRNHIVHAEGTMHVNIFAGMQTAAAIVWMMGVGVLLAGQVAEYVSLARAAARYADRVMISEQRIFLDGLKEQYGIRRRVFLYETTAEERTITFGFFRPVIVCSRDVASREAELLVRHELVHIKRMDVLWKLFMQLAVMLHWCNPMVWILRRDFEQVCECSCDETVMHGKTKEEVKEYLRLMIEEAREKKTERGSPRWKSDFGDNAQKIRERMENLMRGKKWNRIAAVMLVATLAFANSMTVFAYRDSFERELPENTSQEEIEMTMQNDTFLFIPEEMDEEVVREFKQAEMLDVVQEIQYDRQFMDETGNIYPIAEDDGIEPYCNHTFVSGTGYDHTKTSDGGCIMREFYAQRCSKCGYVIQGDWINTITFAKCPH
ncbi:MAG: M56 family metallopeptidase [Lachnospiraceae bacterium]|nr:M56 family metallopeptidase [Lachnospiraceae bacterium]